MSDISDADVFSAAMNDAPATTEPSPAPEAPAVAQEAPAQPVEPVTPAAPAAEPTVIDEQGHRIPLSEHLAEREKRQAAERRAEDAERRAQEIERQFRQAQQPPRQAPDALENPQAYAEHLQSEMDRRMRGYVVNMSFDMVRETNPGGFDAAWAALQKQVQAGNGRLRDEIVGSVNPGAALMRWHQREETLRQIGEGGIDGFKTRTLDDALKDPAFRTRAMEAWRAEATQQTNGSPLPSPSLPSLNRTTGQAARQAVTAMSDAEIFANATARR